MKCLALIISLLASPAVFAAQVTFDREAAAVTGSPESFHEVGGLFDVTSPADCLGRHRATARELVAGNAVLWLSPPPACDGVREATFRTVPRIFSDDFEGGSPLAWTLIVGWPDGEGGNMGLDPYEVYWVAHMVDAAGADYLFSDHGFGASASGDTPANTRIVTGAQFASVVDWKAFEMAKSDGNRAAFPLPGGVVKWQNLQFSVPSTFNPDTNYGTLDYLRDADVFFEQALILWACLPTRVGDEWVTSALAGSNCAVAARFTVTAAGFQSGGRDIFGVTAREQTEAGLNVATTPDRLYGLGGGAVIETGGAPSSGARISRPDQSAIRGTGDQSFAWVGTRGTGDAGSAAYTLLDSPIFRLRRDVFSDVLTAQFRNAAGSWVSVGSPVAFPAATLMGTLTAYDAGTTSATFYADGTISGSSTTITGGLFAAGAAATTFYNAPTVGTMEITTYRFRHWQAEITAAEALEKTFYSLDYPNETSLTCALEFTARVSTSVLDRAGNASALLEGFVDADAAWTFSGTGEEGQSRSRLPAIIGRPLNSPAAVLDAAFRVYTLGFEGKVRSHRFVTMAGARMRAPFSTNGTTDFVAAGRQVKTPPSSAEPAVGQELTVAAGPNAGTITVAELAVDPVLGDVALTQAVFTVDESIVDDPGRFTAITGTGDWTNASSVLVDGVSAVQVLVGVSGKLGLSLAAGLDDQRLGESLIERLGPETTPTLTDLKVLSLEWVGWRGDGAAAALTHAPAVMQSTPSADDSPSIVYRNTSSGKWTVRGFDRTPAAATFTWTESQIRRAIEKPRPGRVATVRALYARNYSHGVGEDVATPAAAWRDPLASALVHETREVEAGSGFPEYTQEVYLLRAGDAQDWATSVLDIAQNGKLYEIHFKGPRPLAEVTTLEPFDVADVTWSKDTFLASGKKACIVGYAPTKRRAWVLAFP